MENIAESIKIEVEDLSPVKKKLNITVSKGLVAEEFNSAYKKLMATTAISGFRKGSVPVSVLKARFGEDVGHEVAARLVEVSYSHALGEKNFSPIVRPELHVMTDKLDEGADFAYSATFEITPTIEVDGYMGIELEGEDIEVTDEEVDKGIKGLQQNHFQFKEVERPSKEGDLVNIDFEASRDGKPIKGVKSQDYAVVIGRKTLLPGLDKAVEGTRKGDKKEFTITFPKNYSERKLAGRDALFRINVKSVKEKVFPEIDDEFAKDLECDSLEKLREKVSGEIKKSKEARQKEMLKNQVLDKLIEAHPFEVPDSLVSSYLAMILNSVVDNMRLGIIAPGDQGLGAEELKTKYKDVALRRVKEDIILDSIVKKEYVEISQEETEKSVKDLAAMRGVPFEALMRRIEAEGSLEVIKDGLKHEKVFDIILGESKPASRIIKP